MTGTELGKSTQNYGNVTGAARPADPKDAEKKGDFIVAFDGIPCRLIIKSIIITHSDNMLVQDSDSDEGGVPNYRVVATDYDSFAVVYNCKTGYVYNSGKKESYQENYDHTAELYIIIQLNYT